MNSLLSRYIILHYESCQLIAVVCVALLITVCLAMLSRTPAVSVAVSVSKESMPESESLVAPDSVEGDTAVILADSTSVVVNSAGIASICTCDTSKGDNRGIIMEG